MRVVNGLTALFAGALVVLLVQGTGLRQTSSFSEARDAPAAHAQLPLSTVEPDTDPNDLELVTSARSAEDGQGALIGQRTMAEARIDEDARRRARGLAMRDVRDSYSLLLDGLDLARQEAEELLSYLVDVRIARATIFGRGGTIQQGRTIGEDERSSRIAAIIGSPKLQRFLALEHNLVSYSETRRLESMLESEGVPLTEAQRDGLFDILAATRNREYAPLPSGQLDPYSLEQLERTLMRMDERDRHLIQLAPSVLSPQQVVHLHARYQDCSYERADALERQKSRRAADSENPRPVSYPACGP